MRSGDATRDPILDSRLKEIVKNNKLSGIVAATWGKGELLRIGAAGVRRVGSLPLLQTTDKMHLGSCTKAMTSTLVAILVEDGLLTMHSTLCDIFGDWDMIHPQVAKITVRQLMLHRSGLAGDPSLVKAWALPANKSNQENRVTMLQEVLQKAPDHNSDDWIFQYSNLGYIVLGAVVEQVTGQSWEYLMQKRLFGPLNITSAGFGKPADDTLPPMQPWGHSASGQKSWIPWRQGGPQPKNVDNPKIYGPAGTVHMSLEDWAKFASLHLLEHSSDSILSHDALAALQDPTSPGPSPSQPGITEYASGWVVAEREWAGGKVLMHSGSNTVWFSTIWLAPRRDLAFLAVTNTCNHKATNDAVAAMLDLLDDAGTVAVTSG